MPRSIPVEHPLDLRRTVRGTATWGAAPWLKVDATGAWYAARTADGPGTVRLTLSDRTLLADAWGPGAARLLDAVPRLAGLHDDAHLFEPTHPLIFELTRRATGVRIAAITSVFPTLMGVILGQKVTGREGKIQMKRIAWEWGEPAPGPREDLLLMPVPEQVANTPYYAFHPLGIERKRANILIECARRAKRIEEIMDMSFEAADRRLQALRGIGPWTSGVVLGEALGDPDAVPVGDYHLPNFVAFNLAGEPRADDDRMLELLEPFRGQRGRVVRMLKTGGAKPPKWGPRGDVRDIRTM